MKNTAYFTPLFPDFHRQIRRRNPRAAQQKLAEKLALLQQKSFKQIGEVFEKFIPHALLKKEASGSMSRSRLFSKENTFWAFFSQVLDADGGCMEVIRKLQSYASIKGIKIPSSSTASYCTARKKLPEQMLSDIFAHTADRLEQIPESGILHNRRVIVVDGTGVSMPDTSQNQEVWPQLSSQKAGCGFPSARICACFSLKSGALLSYAIGNKKNNELPLFRKQWHIFEQGDIFLGDKGFCSYFDIANLKKQSVDSVITLARRSPGTTANCLKVLGPDDLLIAWKRPVYTASMAYSKEEWASLPKELVLRQIKVSVSTPGFRTKGFYIITTLGERQNLTIPKLPPLQGEGWGGDGVNSVISANWQDQPHPPPNLPLEGGGTIICCRLPYLMPCNIQRRNWLSFTSSDGMSSYFFATSRRPWGWTSCAAKHPK